MALTPRPRSQVTPRIQDRLARLNERWRTGKGGVTQVILAPEDQEPRERPPDEPPVLQH